MENNTLSFSTPDLINLSTVTIFDQSGIITTTSDLIQEKVTDYDDTSVVFFMNTEPQNITYINSNIPELNTGHLAQTTATSNGNCELYNFVVRTIIIGGTCLFGITGNTLAQMTFWKGIKSNSTSFLLVVLAFLDNILLTCQFLLNSMPALCQYFDTGSLYLRYVYPVFIAYGWPVVSVMQLSSAWNIVVVTFYRYIAVCQPHQMERFTSIRKARMCITVILTSCVLFYIPAIASKILTSTGTKIKVSVQPYVDTDAYFVYNVLFYYILIYVIPFSMLITMTYFLMRDLRKTAQRHEVMTKKKKDENDITVTLVSVVLVFMVCQMANPIRRLASALSGDTSCGSFYFYLRSITTWFVVLNSAVNFIIYCLCGRRFRKQFLNRTKCYKQVEPVTSIGTMESKI